MHLSHAFSAAMSFRDHWQNVMWAKLEEKYKERLSQSPARQDVATGNHYGENLYKYLKEKKEVRNVTCNLAWTPPTTNTMLQTHISLATVQRFAIDMFIDTFHRHVADMFIDISIL